MSDSTSTTESDSDIDAGSKKSFLWAKKDSYGYTSGIIIGWNIVYEIRNSRWLKRWKAKKF